MKELEIGIALVLGIGRLLLNDLLLIALPLGIVVGPLIIIVVIVIRSAKVAVVAQSCVTVCYMLVHSPP